MPELSIVWPALIAGLLVTATHAPLGIQVLNRGIVFIDLAVAQIAGLGVIVADAFGFEPQGAAVQAAALALEAFLDEAPEQGLPALFPLLGKLIDLGEQTLVYINEDTEQIGRRMILRASRH